jgi:hypothetical protein
MNLNWCGSELFASGNLQASGVWAREGAKPIPTVLASSQRELVAYEREPPRTTLFTNKALAEIFGCIEL